MVWYGVRSGTRDRVANARLILRSRKVRSEDDIAAVKAVVGNAVGVFTVAAIVSAVGLGARGFYAVVGLIDDGWLAPVGSGRIDYLTRVRRVSAEGA